MTTLRAALAVVFLCSIGCAVRKPAVYRLMPRDNRQILVPPGAASPDTIRRTIVTDATKGKGSCPAEEAVTIESRKTHVRAVVDAPALAKQPPGWLGRWSADLESQGCIAPGDGGKLAQDVLEALPLELNASFRLLYPNDRVTGELDVLPRSRFHVLSPVVREPGAPNFAGPPSVTGDDRHLNVTVQSTGNLIGYEMAWYEAQPRPDKLGVTILPLSAETHCAGPASACTESHGTQPAVNYFRFPAEARFYRLFYEADTTDYAALVVAAETPAELARRTTVLETGPAACSRLPADWCVTIPKDVAVNLLLPVTVNGKEALVTWGATVATSIRAGGEPQPSVILPRLFVQKPYRGRAVAVKFDQASQAILDMILTGGETISWR